MAATHWHLYPQFTHTHSSVFTSNLTIFHETFNICIQFENMNKDKNIGATGRPKGDFKLKHNPVKIKIISPYKMIW